MYRKFQRLRQNIVGTNKTFQYISKCKVNKQSPVVFLYTNDKASARDIKKAIAFSKVMPFLGISLTKEVKDL